MLMVKLILLVKERKLLYDSGDADYNNRIKVRKAWRDINREMGSENGKSYCFLFLGLILLGIYKQETN